MIRAFLVARHTIGEHPSDHAPGRTHALEPFFPQHFWALNLIVPQTLRFCYSSSVRCFALWDVRAFLGV